MTKPFRVLTVDGGGMRGIYSAAFLAGMDSLFSRERGAERLDIGKGFDLIAGTSTGAIVGCAAAVDVAMNDVVNLYKTHGKDIFPKRLAGGILNLLPQLWSRPKYLKQGDDALRSALLDVLGDQTIASVYEKRGIALAIPAIEMGQQRSWVFKSAHLGGHRDDNFTLAEVCLATSAAPIYRSLAAIPNRTDYLGGHRVFTDGGLWANNPVLVALIDSIKMAPKDRPIEMFALGTCPRAEGEHIALAEVHRGPLGWKFGGKALEVSLSAQAFAYDNMARMLSETISDLGRSIEVIRFPNGQVPSDTLQYLDLDDTRPEAMSRLISQAQADVNLTKSACDDRKNAEGQKIAALFRDMPTSA